MLRIAYALKVNPRDFFPTASNHLSTPLPVKETKQPITTKTEKAEIKKEISKLLELLFKATLSV